MLAPSQIRIESPPGERGNLSAHPVALGGSGGSILTGTHGDILEPNQEVAGDLWYGRPGHPGVVAEMMRDPHVRSSISGIVGNLRQGTWAFEAAQKVADKELATEIADACTWQFFELIDWPSTIETQARVFQYGFSILEYTDTVRPTPPGRFPRLGNSSVVYSGFHERPAWSITDFKPRTDDQSKLSYVVQQSTEYGAEVSIPASRLIRTTQEQEGSKFTGFPVARSAYGPWKMKRVLQVVRMFLHERTGAGLPSMTLPEKVVSEDEYRIAQSLLESIRAHEKGSLTLPHGYVFSWNTNDGLGSVASALEAAIEKCDKDIAHNTSSGFMLLGGGSYALAEVQQTQHQITADVFASTLERPWNRGLDGWSPVKRFVAVNYGEKIAESYSPLLVVRNLPTRRYDKTMPLLTNLVSAGIVTPDDKLEEWARVSLNAPARDVETSRELKGNIGATAQVEVAHDSSDTQDSVDTENADAGSADGQNSGSQETEQTAAIQAVALNGAQVAEAREILNQVAAKSLPRSSGIEALVTFFGVDRNQAEAVMGDIGRSFYYQPEAAP